MRLFCRAFEPDDYILINRWRNDPEIAELTCSNVSFVSSLMERQWVEGHCLNNSTDVYLAICLAETGEMVGYQSIRNIDHKNLCAQWGGIVIGKKELWNKGIATEASRMLLEYVFEELNIHLFWSYVLESHTSSRRMIAKLGFSETGYLPESIFKHGTMHTQIVISLLREEYRRLKQLEQCSRS